MKNHALYFTGLNSVEILEEEIPKLKYDEVLIKNLMSGISAGTEILFYQGLVPDNLNTDESIPTLQRKIQYPCKYGYSSIGKIIEVGNTSLSHIINRLVFVLNPHETYFTATEKQILLLPEDISPEDGIFLANMETAVNLILDGSPLIGENVLVLGLGIIGLLTTALLQQFPITTLAGVDIHQKRREISLELGANKTFNVSNNSESEIQHYFNSFHHSSIDLIYELTGNPQALNSAISLAPYEGRIVLGSWYGNKSSTINLGGKFHRNRIKLITSQVSTLASELHGRWDKSRRFQVAVEMLRKIKPSRFISHRYLISQADEAYTILMNHPGETLQVILTYD